MFNNGKLKHTIFIYFHRNYYRDTQHYIRYFATYNSHIKMLWFSYNCADMRWYKRRGIISYSNDRDNIILIWVNFNIKIIWFLYQWKALHCSIICNAIVYVVIVSLEKHPIWSPRSNGRVSCYTQVMNIKMYSKIINNK